MNRTEKMTLLIIDDQIEVLEVYEDVLQNQMGHQVECVSMPSEALRHVRERLFDMVIIDAKISYKGAPLGGLNLADDISGILGMNSVILMSQYDVREEVRFFNPSYTFLPKPKDYANTIGWVKKELLGKINSLIARQYGFVAMPFSDEQSNEWYKTRLVPWMKEAGFEIKRMDEIATTRPINQELLTRIIQSHFVVLYASKKNPNVYFEAGFAWAHNKYMVILSPHIDDLPFDIRSNFVISLSEVDEQQTYNQVLQLMRGLRGLLK